MSLFNLKSHFNSNIRVSVILGCNIRVSMLPAQCILNKIWSNRQHIWGQMKVSAILHILNSVLLIITHNSATLVIFVSFRTLLFNAIKTHLSRNQPQYLWSETNTICTPQITLITIKWSHVLSGRPRQSDWDTQILQ